MKPFARVVCFFARFVPKERPANRAPKPLCPACGKELNGKGFCAFCYRNFCVPCLKPHVEKEHPIRIECPECGSRGRFRPQLAISVQVPGTEVVLEGYCICPKCGAEWSARGDMNA